VSQYPGSWVGVRYAQVDVSFTLCGADPAGWNATVSKSQVYSFGKNLGFFIDGSPTVKPTGSGPADKTFQLEIPHTSCLPRVGWPCYGSGSMFRDFRVTMDGPRPVVHPQPPRVDDISLRLYDTP
jgi:hypothetical protein